MTHTAEVHGAADQASRMAAEAHEAAAAVLQARHPRAARRQREAAVAARARLLRAASRVQVVPDLRGPLAHELSGVRTVTG
jgi:hypothetical protein